MGTTNNQSDPGPAARKAPTIKQMVARSLPVHRRILSCIVTGTSPGWPGESDSEIRGRRTARDTLWRWGCIEATADNKLALTERGRQLLEALGGAK